MPAPTALQRAPDALAVEETLHDAPRPALDQDVLITTTDQPTPDTPSEPSQPPRPEHAMEIDDADPTTTPLFSPEPPTKLTHRIQERKIRIPPHRLTPLKTLWPKIYPPLVEHLHLQIRMNLPKKTVELRTSRHHTTDPGAAIQKGADFLQAFCLGFDLDDAIALLRLDDLYIQSFEIKDVKSLSGEHLSRAVGRIAGKDGKTKFAIENASRTRIVLAEQKVHILGGFRNLHVAREAIVSLILGSPPGKVYGDLRTVGARMKERF
ncbi:Pre-rRNA-processing protein PNO1 [Friedmanniomyces simplex]|uniref:Pre-rRNA-processing protein PNO1 n=1 Tax=Friedmanniomyces simplex TaxID=329884 RepID=A0A4U0X452_9PEZI|nr:Pre-rRNA-processing protein PNO1 [Friedmanniomyces simplex]